MRAGNEAIKPSRGRRAIPGALESYPAMRALVRSRNAAGELANGHWMWQRHAASCSSRWRRSAWWQAASSSPNCSSVIGSDLCLLNGLICTSGHTLLACCTGVRLLPKEAFLCTMYICVCPFSSRSEERVTTCMHASTRQNNYPSLST